jgi:hypothetical protein
MLIKTNKETEQTMSKGKTIKQFIKENNLTMNCEYADSNPNMPDSNNMNHSKVTIKRKFKLNGNHLDTRYGFRQMTLYFSQGYGIQGEPTLESVLGCLLSDSFSFTNGDTFKDFCENYGYDYDSRKAEKTYQATIKQTSKLKKLLDNNFNDFVNCEQL